MAFTCFIDSPISLTDWIQASGRAGRGGSQHALCLMLVAKTRKRQPGEGEEDFSGKVALRNMLLQNTCLRTQPSQHFDGIVQTCSDLVPEGSSNARLFVAPCSWCQRNVQMFRGEDTLALLGEEDEYRIWWSFPFQGKCWVSFGLSLGKLVLIIHPSPCRWTSGLCPSN